MADLPLTGGCNCGGVRFEIDAPPRGAGYCHCKRCQRRTGTASSAQAYLEPGSCRIVRGEELLRAWQPPDRFAKVFCSVCGSSLFTTRGDDPTVLAVRLGVFDGDPGVRPALRQFVDSAASWEPIPDDGLPRYPERQTA